MKKNGFTLIELLAVIIILALLMLVTFPSVLNNIKTSQDSIEETVIVLIENSAKLYIRLNLDKIPNEEKTYCIPISKLVETGNLDEEIIGASDNITIDYIVEAKYNNNEFLFSVSKNCEGEELIADV